MTRLLTRTEVCQRVNLSYVWVWQLAREGKFPRPILIAPRSPRWHEAELDQWIADRARVVFKDQKIVRKRLRKPI